MKKILAIITGSIAAYKCVDFLRKLEDESCELDVIITKSAEQFITKLTLSSLLKAKIYTDETFNEQEPPMLHINLARERDLVIVIPASADFISKITIGSANSLSLASILASNVPIIIAPAMNPNMWNNIATQANIKTLKERNFIIVEPMSGKVACGDVGYGKLPDDQVLLNIVNNILGKGDPINEKLKDKQAIITIGSTRERIDPVRFIGNYSTGEQGLLIAEELRRCGCEVSIISGYTTKEIPEYFKIIKAYTATDMLNASLSLMPADIFIGCAAICDFKPKEFSQQKIKKCNIPKTFQQADLILSGERSECTTTYMRTRSHEKIKNGFLKGEGYKKISLDLIETVDVIGSIGSMKEGRPSVVVGFALESSDFKENAKAKLKSKNLDLIVLNKSNEMFNENKEFALFSAKGNIDLGKLSKRQLSSELISQIAFFI